MTESAPVLRDASKPVLTAVYEAWRAHHAACRVCGAQDWYMPGAPRLLREAEAELWHHRLPVNGRTVVYSNYEDLAVLCAKGAKRFRSWVATAMKAGVPQLEKVE